MNTDNLRIYNAARQVPAEAQKAIAGGRLKGMTDINPMWRIKKLTEIFGPCGIGWKYRLVNREFVTGQNGEISCFVDIELNVCEGGKWSDPIPGTGGSMFVVQERNGLYTDDEAPKKALTDALSVACKALGIGADVYFAGDRTKYDQRQTSSSDNSQKNAHIKFIRESTTLEQAEQICAKYKVGNLNELSADRAAKIAQQLKDRQGVKA